MFMLRSLAAGWVSAAMLAAQPPPAWHWLATDRIGSLTPPATLSGAGLAGTDLGVSFPCGEQLLFLFGDSWTLDRRDRDVDSVAATKLAPLPTNGAPALTWFVGEHASFLPLAVRDVPLGGMEVPVEGLVVGDRTYVFFSSGWDPRRGRHQHSALAHTTGTRFAQLELDHLVATDKFVNVSVVADGDQLWIFGTGAYRKSAVYLARVAASELANRSAWRYWPDFEPDEAAAKVLVASDCIGELSVRRLPDGCLLMAYNAAVPRGIHLRTAATPAGPWSDAVVIFDPSRDRGGYGSRMHQAASAVGYDDGLSEPGRENEWGGEYGPYLVPEWCSSPATGVHGLVYALSTWNPYSVQLMRSYVAEPGIEVTLPPSLPAAAPAKAPRNLDFAGGTLTGWQQEGDAFTTGKRGDGSWFVCTYVAPADDAVRGSLSQEFTVPATARELRGFVFGGSEAVQLWCGDELLRSTRGRCTNDVETPLRWRLDEYRGQRVRLVIRDESTAKWGFVSVRGLTLVE